jgi:YHS domain-containing protein
VCIVGCLLDPGGFDMPSSKRFPCVIFALLGAACFWGCGAEKQPAVPASQATSEATADDEIAKALAQLENPADRDAAKQQAICPVSDHALGSMGAPIKVAHDGKEAFLCCEGCKEEFDKDPATFLAKVKK